MTKSKEKQELNNVKPEEIVARRSALLDFYSDRTVSFASFFIASIFGLVTVVAIIHQIGYDAFLIPISLLVFWTFAYAGYFTFQRFSHYADFSDKLREDIQKKAKLDEVYVSTKRLRGNEWKKICLVQYHLETVNSQEQIFGKELIMKKYYFVSDKEGKPQITIKLFDLLYWILMWLLGLLAFLQATQYSIPSIVAFSFSLIIIFTHEELKGWMKNRRKFKWFLRLMFLAMYIIFVIYIII